MVPAALPQGGCSEISLVVYDSFHYGCVFTAWQRKSPGGCRVKLLLHVPVVRCVLFVMSYFEPLMILASPTPQTSDPQSLVT